MLALCSVRHLYHSWKHHQHETGKPSEILCGDHFVEGLEKEGCVCQEVTRSVKK